MAPSTQSPFAGHVPVYAFVGNPNCGKSTLFNALTGATEKVGNYPGVTVERKIGETYSQHGRPIRIVDLPGAYSLAAHSPDEAVLRDVLLGRRADTPQPDRIVCILDAANLQRSLYLVHQILDLGLPVILVLNMMDLAAQAGMHVRTDRLERELGVPVVACEAVSGKGVRELRLAMSRADLPLARHRWDIPARVAPAVAEIAASLAEHDRRPPLIARAEALLLLTDADAGRVAGTAPLSPHTSGILQSWQRRWKAAGLDWSSAFIRGRQEAVRRWCDEIVERSPAGPSATDRIDAIALHPVWGWLVFGAVMVAFFLSIFVLAEYPMDWIDGCVTAVGAWVQTTMPSGDLRDLLTDGVIAGVGGVIVFLPQILILFFFVGLLEGSGYMARVAFLMDRFMGRVGLSGRSFISLLGSYACAIPGIMATRTIGNARDRLVTILIAPLMSCSARLPVYLLMIAALLPGDRVSAFARAGIMILLYALGTGGAFVFAWLFKRTLLRGAPPAMILELPLYHAPSLRGAAMQMLERAWVFLRSAGTIILTFSIVLWALTTYPKHPDPAATSAEKIAHSFAGHAGRILEPIIKPLGFDWRIGVGIVGSFAAREVFVSSTAVVFNVDRHERADPAAGSSLRRALARATWPDGTRLFTPLVCLTLMIYYVFAMQCISTVVIVQRETRSWRWPLFQIGYMTGTAWIVCFVVHHAGRALGF